MILTYNRYKNPSLSVIALLRIAAIVLFAIPADARDVAIQTNLLHWATTTPNAGIDVSLSDRFSLALSFGYNNFNFPNKYNSSGRPANPKLHHWVVIPEARMWLRRAFDGTYLGFHLLGGRYNAGGINFPKFLRTHRYEGYALGAGVSFGHEWKIADDWRLGASVGAGWMYLNYNKYECEACGKRESHRARNIAAVTKASLSISYLIPARRSAIARSETQTAIPPYIPTVDVKEEMPEQENAPSVPAATPVSSALADDKREAANDTLRLIIHYGVNSHDFSIDRLGQALDSLQDCEIQSVQIDGYASPEYTAPYNLLLSERRARGVAASLSLSLDIPASSISVTAHGDDWEGLAREAEAAGFGDVVGGILRNSIDPEARKQALRSLKIYRILLDKVYPLLRRTEMTIIYNH